MSLDPEMKSQLIEARKSIAEQLDRIEDISARGSFALRRGPPDFRDVYAELQKELREINELLGDDDVDEGSPSIKP